MIGDIHSVGSSQPRGRRFSGYNGTLLAGAYHANPQFRLVPVDLFWKRYGSMSHDRYENPLLTRYASSEMAGIWSAQTKHGLWRRLWIALAESEQELGLPIEDAQLREMRITVLPV